MSISDFERRMREEKTMMENTNKMGEELIGMSDIARETEQYLDSMRVTNEVKPMPKIKEFGNVVTVMGHNQPEGVIRNMLDVVTDNYIEAMRENNLPLHQEIKIRIYEEMRADEYQASPPVVPYTSVSWKVEVETNE